MSEYLFSIHFQISTIASLLAMVIITQRALPGKRAVRDAQTEGVQCIAEHVRHLI